MKNQFILVLTAVFMASISHAQQIKKQPADTVRSGKSNDRLRNAGPKEGWPLEGKADTAKKINKTADPARRSKQRGNQ